MATFKWKAQEEIDKEKEIENLKVTGEERIEALETAILYLMLE